MRTTLSIDDDVLFAAQDQARRDRRSVGAVISELARAALIGPNLEQDADDEFLGFRPFARREGVVVTNELINRLRDEGLD